ncbi:exported hypothetical protein [Verrucomicrobia bacterium]|nr:exported hypothetical protein [Verrucomicrobiota bacterium]
MIRKQTRLALLAVAAVAVTSTAQAAYNSGDLLVGFTSSGAANDYIFDVGTLSGLGSSKTWNLGADLGGDFTSSQFASADWGVIGALSLTHTIYSSAGSAGVPSEIPNGFNTINTDVKGVGANSVTGSEVMPGRTTANSWYFQTDQAAGTPGNYFFNNLDNPNNQTGVAAYLYANDNNGDPATLLGNFTISQDGSTLTFTAVPEPASVSALAGLGLLVAGLRRRFTCKA